MWRRRRKPEAIEIEPRQLEKLIAFSSKRNALLARIGAERAVGNKAEVDHLQQQQLAQLARELDGLDDDRRRKGAG
jgi:hypothetical protein